VEHSNVGVGEGTLESEKWWNIATLESEKEHWSRRNGGNNHDGSCSKSGGLSQSHLLNIRS
jgi:hypothetical protein